jgi:hypothetical protein
MQEKGKRQLAIDNKSGNCKMRYAAGVQQGGNNNTYTPHQHWIVV